MVSTFKNFKIKDLKIFKNLKIKKINTTIKADKILNYSIYFIIITTIYL
jgi:hypothetical protein